MIRKAKPKDFPILKKIYANARNIMKENLNPNQWEDTYPSDEIILNDYNTGDLYVLEDEEIYGAFTFIIGKDPTYAYIRGSWLNDKPYGTIHRIASMGIKQGVFKETIEYTENLIDNIRIDTHKDNIIMLNLIKKYGFKYCGIIFVRDKKERLAFQREKICY